jgi:hypothetical protein
MREAILAHAGEAQRSTDSFKALADHERDCIIEFLKTLQVLPPGTESLVVDEKLKPRSWDDHLVHVDGPLGLVKKQEARRESHQ